MFYLNLSSAILTVSFAAFIICTAKVIHFTDILIAISNSGNEGCLHSKGLDTIRNGRGRALEGGWGRLEAS